ncbi:MAG: enoyl-CoA hydratase-related protein [Actinomycetota bacterium]|jgi:enoyl-CoA hydratase/carnithine racemase|nr:enoyl-CoA hydratase-related protein [Actinomycetota bacterium]MDA3015157.1 enoyl-CoA hydratase-related protein [Actinomycetota bacterium]MDA3027405.1 enoyl-CoA hydratase-related protein [Actinomycetota bacterium]
MTSDADLPESESLRAVRWTIDGPVAIVTLHRPHRANAWNGTMHAEFIAVMRGLEHRDGLRAVVVTGSGSTFSVGGDSQALGDHAERGSYDTGLDDDIVRPGAPLRSEYDDDLAWMLGYRLPIIAAVNGAVAGVSLALVCFCDLRFGSAPAKFTTAAPKLGLPAEYGLSWTLPRLIGTTRAADLLLSGRVITVADTADWGLWNEVLPDGETTLEAAVNYARLLAATTGPEAVSNAKAQIHGDWLRPDPAASVRESKALLDQAMGTAEYREGIAAFVEKRQPRF